MPYTIPLNQSPIRLQLEPLTQEAFQPFGTVTQNPIRSTSSSLNPNQLAGIEADFRSKGKLVDANQGTAHKFIDVVDMTSRYGQAESGTGARVRVSMFACKGRVLRREADGQVEEAVESVGAGMVTMSWSRDALSGQAKQQGQFESVWKDSKGTGPEDNKRRRHFVDIPVLERHPYTPQTFVPLGLNAGSSQSCYVVVVAPNSKDSLSEGSHLENIPDLAQARAFMGHGGQAVTYATATWHAPMVVVGEGIDFVVVQWGNGVAEEDCQEVYAGKPNSGEHHLAVIIDLKDDDGTWGSSFKTKL